LGRGARKIADEKEMTEFLETMSDRLQSKIPFAEFAVALWNIPLGLIQKFAELIGPSVRKLEVFRTATGVKEERTPTPEEIRQNQFTVKLTTILSNLPRMEGIMIHFNDFPLSKYDLRRLPKTFPELVVLYGKELLPVGSGKSFLKTIIQRSPRFDTLVLEVTSKAASITHLPSILYEPQRPILPTSTLELALKDRDVGILRELKARGYNRIQKLNCYLMLQDPSVALDLMTSFNELLGLQAETLETLFVRAFYLELDPTFQLILPVEMKKLKHLHLGNLAQEDEEIMSIRQAAIGNPTRILRPLQPAQCPALVVLEVGLFDSSVQTWLPSTVVYPSVKSFKMACYVGPIQAVSWHLNFPNLAQLEFKRYAGPDMLSYILTRLTSLGSLNLGFGHPATNKFERKVLWDLYTGEAPLISQEEMLKLESFKNGKQKASKVKDAAGDAGLPSLANMKRNNSKLKIS